MVKIKHILSKLVDIAKSNDSVEILSSKLNLLKQDVQTKITNLRGKKDKTKRRKKIDKLEEILKLIDTNLEQIRRQSKTDEIAVQTSPQQSENKTFGEIAVQTDKVKDDNEESLRLLNIDYQNMKDDCNRTIRDLRRQLQEMESDLKKDGDCHKNLFEKEKKIIELINEIKDLEENIKFLRNKIESVDLEKHKEREKSKQISDLTNKIKSLEEENVQLKTNPVSKAIRMAPPIAPPMAPPIAPPMTPPPFLNLPINLTKKVDTKKPIQQNQGLLAAIRNGKKLRDKHAKRRFPRRRLAEPKKELTLNEQLAKGLAARNQAIHGNYNDSDVETDSGSWSYSSQSGGYKYIHNPLDNQFYKISSNLGMKLLKGYIGQFYKN